MFQDFTLSDNPYLINQVGNGKIPQSETVDVTKYYSIVADSSTNKFVYTLQLNDKVTIFDRKVFGIVDLLSSLGGLGSLLFGLIRLLYEYFALYDI